VSSPCDKLQVFADGELPAAERPAFHRHLAGCGACQEALESALMLDALAASFSDERAQAGGEVPAPAGPAALPPPPR
jgi:anti-sigma factor RsiW